MAETVAMPSSSGAPPRAPSSVSRLSSTSVEDEGRFLPGTLVAGRYRVIGLIGRGGMGEVYRATDLMLGQSVALKFLPEGAAANEHLLERFHNEVRVARQVSHPNVCRVYDIGEADGMPFISMEYVDGEDLASLLLRIGRLPADKALDITRKICAGLSAAHERGVIHRDLKPHNIMLNRRGEAVIMDFGLAAVADELKGAEARNGTPAYMSPEQLRGDSVTAKSDLYSLGLIVYELFTGKRAFEAKSVQEMIALQESGKPPSITSAISDADPAVERVVLRCLNADPAFRPASALSIAAALPGGDPLAAALAAGETPSPELVAASGKTEGFALRYALPCLVFVLAVLLTYPFVMPDVSTLALSPMPYPRPVLEQKARDMAAAFGWPEQPADWKSWFEIDNDYISHLRSHPPGPKDWRRLFDTESPVRFYYRQSPEYLKSPPDGQITPQRPPLNVPGMLSVYLDSRGRLRGFEAVAPREDRPDAAPPIAPAVLFQSAGLDFSNFREVQPSHVPPLPFDSRRAWTGRASGVASSEVTVEAAFWRGKVTSVALWWPWSKPFAVARDTVTPFDLFVVIFFSTTLFCVVFFARRNLRLGRGDREGAFRLAACVFAIYCCVRLADTHLMPSFTVLAYLFADLGLGVLISGLLWLLYVAIEPAVRARWPQCLITWNRLLAGNIRDPRVASHILIGLTLGAGLGLVFLSRSYWGITLGNAPDSGNLGLLLGARDFAHVLGNIVFSAIQTGFVMFFLLCGIRGLVRRDWIAALVAAALLTPENVQRSANLLVDVPLLIAIIAVFSLVMLRMGLVPAMTGIFAVNTLGNYPACPDVASWYAPAAATMLGLIAAIAIYAFARSQARPAVGGAQAAATSIRGR